MGRGRGADVSAASERLYLTADKERIVSEGDSEARFLLCTEGEDVPEEFEHLTKMKAKPANKAAPKPDNK